MKVPLVGLAVFALIACAGCAAREPLSAVSPAPELRSPVIPRQDSDVIPSLDEDLPRFGDYVYVEQLPEAISKPGPEYPEVPRETGVSGTVMVQALVGRDGRVKDTRIVKSIPMLDAAAIACVRQWVFKPALTHGQPVAVWVAVPVAFRL
jgi:TonB family protein